MNKVTLYSSAILLLMIACKQPDPQPAFDDGTSRFWKAEQAPFYHGVASGDPLADAVIIWTRVTTDEAQQIEGAWRIATDEQMENIIQEGSFTTGADRDYTVKVDVQDLAGGTYYYYQFEALGKFSPVGRTKTAVDADEDEAVRFAIVSCSNYEAGYFNAFGRIAKLNELDAVLHLGDYIYEYEVGRYGDTTLDRHHLPDKEIISLQDYRTRYSLYRLDEDFQAAHRAHPFITIWDDHEISNNAYQTGAQNHQPAEEGDYELRKSAARQAYYEWLPVRENEEQHLYRNFHYGERVDLIMLDERLAGRSPPADSVKQENFRSAERSMLGKEQLAWLKEQLRNSRAQWKIIGNQVIFSPLDMSALGRPGVVNLDAWAGYPAEQEEIARFLQRNTIENVIFVTGDTHRAWAFEVPESLEAYKQDSTAAVAVEFGATSITSANTDESLPVDTVRMIERASLNPAFNPHLKYNNHRDHGFLLLSLNASEAVADFMIMRTIRERNTEGRTDRSISVKSGSHDLIFR